MDLSRREALKLGVFASGAILFPLQRVVSQASFNRMAESSLPTPFSLPFTQPPVLAPVKSNLTTDFYRLSMRETFAEILPGFQTRIWAYGGSFPGPTIDAQQGRPSVVRLSNDLPSSHPVLRYTPDASLHLHGSASLPQYDGYASDLIQRGYYKDYVYPNFQSNRTLWYHDHAVHQTGPNVYMGLAGMYRIRDAVEQSLPIPSGRYDVPLIVSDAMFDSNGQLVWNDIEEKGVFGDVICVNGRPWPVMQVERRKYRFRILNASVTRSYQWQLDSGDPLVVIATDAGLAPAPRPVKRLRHGSGERYEVVIDFAKYPIGRRVVLRNLSTKNNNDFSNTDKVMAFDVVSEPTSTAGNSIPDVLDPNHPAMTLDPALATATRRLDLVRSGGEWTINGKTWADVIDSGFQTTLANPELNAVEIWEIRNDSGGWHHPLHIHLVDFRVLDRVYDRKGQPKPPLPHEVGPKDVVFVGENERVRVLARFGPHPGRYMVHCHNLVHEDHDMMGQFEVGSGGFDPMTSAPAAPLPAPEW